jgi:hypothetical protein
MKRIILIILVFIISFGFSRLNSNKEVEFSIEKGKELKENAQLYYLIPTSLKNISKDTLYYASMSCSWQDLYYIQDNELFFNGIDCDKNSPIVITLAPRETKKVTLKLRKTHKIFYDHVKLAFNFIKLKSKTDKIDYNLISKINKSNLIYSNVVSFE